MSTNGGLTDSVTDGILKAGNNEPTNGTVEETIEVSKAESTEYDVIIIGAGLSGVTSLYKLRQQGLKVKVFESAAGFGGVWWWNRYPGARVDSEAPFYQLNIPEVWRTWNWSCRFPDHVEIRQYMEHCDKVLGLSKDVQFEARVTSSKWDAEKGRWTVKTNAGHTATAKYVVLATGLLHRRHYPDFPGLSEYAGLITHSGFWPEDVNGKGKKVAIIGAGATAVQITQELAKQADQLTVFLRRPSYCLPMGQRTFTKEEQTTWRSFYPALFQAGRNSAAGFPIKGAGKGVYDVSDEEREKHFEEMWGRGAFNFSLGGFNDVVLNKKSNRTVYDFWAKKTRARISDPVKRDLMAPLEPPYWFSTKRSPLEHDYYEMLDKPNVEIVNLNDTPLKTFESTGIVTEDGKSRPFDMVVLATGFDSFTGSISNMGLLNKEGTDIKESWDKGIHTYLGLMISGFPNLFMVYSPQAPTALSNGPSCIECQVDLVTEAITKMESEHNKSVEPTTEAEEGWANVIEGMNARTLFPLTNSWWTGTNVPGKKPQSLNYIGGIELYEKTCKDAIKEWKGFNVVAA